MFDRGFEPLTVGNLTLRNRIVFPAMGLFFTGEELTDKYVSLYETLADGGAGLIQPVLMSIKSDRFTGPAIYEDRFVPSLRSFTENVHALGAAIVAQLAIGDYRENLQDDTLEYVGPSPVSAYHGAPVPRPLSLEEIEEIVEEIAQAALRANRAGFDGAEFMANGRLLGRFISPVSNKRDDEYGGSVENRYRLLVRIIQRTRQLLGGNEPLMVRICGSDFMPGGAALEDTIAAAPVLEKAGVSALNITTGWHESGTPFVQPTVPERAFIYLAESVKKVVSIPVIGGTSVRNIAVAEEILSQGKVDLVYIGRALLADPYLPAKAMRGETETIRPCIVCNSCLGKAVYGQPVSCAANPALAEKAFPRAEKSRKILVIGGGPAGMQAAITAATRGHHVWLWEKEGKLGGNLIPASVPPYKAELEDLRVYLSRAAKKAGVEVECNKEATLVGVKALSPEVVIVATGATSDIPEIPGVDGDHVATAVEVLLGKKVVEQEVVIVGGGLIGCETADYLLAKAKKVTVLEMLDRLVADYERVNRWVLIQRLGKAGARMETGVKVIEITEKGVSASRNGEVEFFPAQSVVLALGLRPRNELFRQLKGDFALHAIGDCVQAEKIAQALKNAFLLAREL